MHKLSHSMNRRPNHLCTAQKRFLAYYVGFLKFGAYIEFSKDHKYGRDYT